MTGLFSCSVCSLECTIACIVYVFDHFKAQYVRFLGIVWLCEKVRFFIIVLVEIVVGRPALVSPGDSRAGLFRLLSGMSLKSACFFLLSSFSRLLIDIFLFISCCFDFYCSIPGRRHWK